jgi:protein-arginine kinase activator protein McsA
MSGTPKTAAKRHSPRKRVRKKPELKTLRCKNCPVIFKQVKSNQLFHSKECKDDFHHNNAGFGKLRDRLPRFVASAVKRAVIDIEARLSQVELKLLLVERKQLDAKTQAG